MTSVAVKRITEKDLTPIATEFLRKAYGIELAIPIKRNNRLRTTLGRFQHYEDGEPLRIEIAGFAMKYGAYEIVIDTLIHECIHYALMLRGEPCDDGDPFFEAELRKHGVGSTETNLVGPMFLAECGGCGDMTYGKDKGITKNAHRCTSNCCDVPVKYVGERIFDGTEVV